MQNTAESVRLYAQSLFPYADGEKAYNHSPIDYFREDEDPHGLSNGDTEFSCREAVEVLTRNPKKCTWRSHCEGCDSITTGVSAVYISIL
jgi:hypothetical protein